MALAAEVKMNTNKAFVTLATGEYYCWLAENLYKSYKLVKSNNLPFFVVTDLMGATCFNSRKLFDGIKTIQKPTYSFLDKLSIYNLLDVEEIIFIDADCFICGDIVFLFELFETNKSPISCLGFYDEIGKKQGTYEYTNYFNNVVIEKFGLKKYIQLEGGLYYFRHCNIADKVMLFATEELANNYDEFGLNRQGAGAKSDEAIINVAMCIFGMNPLGNSFRNVMDYVYRINMYGYIYKNHKPKWSSLHGAFKVYSCTIDKKRFYREILIPHWTTEFSKTKDYYYFGVLIDCKYKRYSKIKTLIIVVNKLFIYYFKKIINKLKRHIRIKNYNGNT